MMIVCLFVCEEKGVFLGMKVDGLGGDVFRLLTFLMMLRSVYSWVCVCICICMYYRLNFRIGFHAL